MDKIAFEILDKVDSFYSSAFSQLLIITFGIVAFVGVFVPVLVTYYQSRNIKIEKQNLEDHINNKIASIKAEITSELITELHKKLREFKKEQTEKTEFVVGGVLYVQAGLHINELRYNYATNSIISAIESCITAGDELNLSRAFNVLIDQCLPNIRIEEEPDLENLAKRIEIVNTSISKLNSSGRYTDLLNRLTKAHKKAVARLCENEKSKP
jgi:hypothetical protein